MAVEEARASGDNSFENCNSTYVFDQVRRRLESGESRSLWRRIESEMREDGVGAVETYLRSSFAELEQQVRERATHFRESLEG
jgi:hypothetical protein